MFPLVKKDGERATLRLTSYPVPLDKNVNKIELREGRYFNQYAGGGAFEALVDPGFYAANQLHPGSSLDIIANNHQHSIKVVGAATGPEFAYPMKDASTLMTDFTTFGIMMLPHNQAQTILTCLGR